MTQNQKTMILICLKNSKKIFYVALIVVLSFVISRGVSAQGSVSLSVSPTIFQMTANPEQEWRSTMRVVNTNPFELTIYSEVVNFRPLGEDGSSQFIPVNTSDDVQDTLAEWVSVPDTAFVIPPEQTIEIPIVIKLPADAPPGGHYAAVLVGTRPPESKSDTTRVETSQVVSSLIFLRVSGDINESGNIRTFRTTESVIESPSATFELRFENTGNVHLRPEGEIRIFNMWGQERGVIPINQKTLFGNILSESIRSFNFTWTGEWSPADIGRYTAVATLAYGEDQRQFTSADTAFWLIPWKILFGIILVIMVIITLISWLIKLYVRKMFSLAGLNNENPLQQKLAIDRRREVSVVAPIEAGILDLRSRFGSFKQSKVSILLNYISEYRLFFVGLGVFLTTLYLIFWFVGSVSDNNRAFEVTIEGKGQNVTVNSESLQYSKNQVQQEVDKRNVPPIRIINTSDTNGAAANLALILEELGYVIHSVSADLNSSENQTVIVYNPSVADESLEISTILDNALLSSFISNDENEPLITIYLGNDIADN